MANMSLLALLTGALKLFDLTSDLLAVAWTSIVGGTCDEWLICGALKNQALVFY